MNRKKRILSMVLEAGLLIALIAGLSFLLQQRSIFGGPGLTETQSTPIPDTQENNGLPSQPYPAPSQVIPTRTIVQKPPACQFNNPKVSDSESVSQQPVFSEPKVVYTNSSSIGIVRWLPDNERLLITQATSTAQQLIETFDVKTSEIQLYAQREGAYEVPVWVEAINSVAYTNLIGDHEELWLGDGKTQNSALVSKSIFGRSLTTDSKQLIFLSPASEDQLRLWNSESKATNSIPFDLQSWLYPKPSSRDVSGLLGLGSFQLAFSPNRSQIALYANPWLDFFDITTQQICEVDLGEIDDSPVWSFMAKWSPNGQYLAMLTTNAGPGEPYPFSDLTLLDTSNGTIKTISSVAPEVIPGQHFIRDFTWSPDSSYIAAIAITSLKEETEEGLFLINPYDGKVQNIPSSVSFVGGSLGMKIDWSNNGLELAVTCQSSGKPSLCIISVNY